MHETKSGGGRVGTRITKSGGMQKRSVRQKQELPSYANEFVMSVWLPCWMVRRDKKQNEAERETENVTCMIAHYFEQPSAPALIVLD